MKNDSSNAPRIEVGMEELACLMEDVFRQGGTFRFIPAGTSMLPMLREKKDTVMLQSPGRKTPRKYDVVLYKRTNGQFVLHRIIKIKNGCYTMCGDNQYRTEPGIEREQILGVLTSFMRNGKQVSSGSFLYRCYSVIWTKTRFIRRMITGVFRRVRRLF